MPTVVQLTSRHQITDNRILHCMAQTAADAGYNSIVLGPAEKDSHIGTISLQACPIRKQGEEISTPRLLGSLLRAALKSKHRLFQIHDPDLLTVAFMLKLFGRKVIYDVHDDYEASFKDRLAEKKILRAWFPALWWHFEHWAACRLDGVIVADRHLAMKFKRCDPIILGNYPRLDFTERSDPSAEKTFNLIYVGGVNNARGVGVALDAIQKIDDPDLRFHVIGACRDEALMTRLKSESRVVLHGRVPWLELKHYYKKAHIGIALYQPLEGFINCNGSGVVKINEYMAAGIPVLTANFPGFKHFIEDSGCGITVKSDDPDEIAFNIKKLMNQPDLRTKLGDAGRELFIHNHNWEKHQHKLVELYQKVMGL